MFLRSTGLAGLATLAPLAQADVTVGPPGSGAPFSDIQAAIDAVGPGETVFVLPGQYAGPIALAGGVAVVGAGSDQTFLAGGVGVGVDGRHATIANVAQGQQSRLVGFGLTTVDAGGVESVPSGVVIEACAGGVTLADVVYAPAPAVTPPGLDLGALLTVVDGAQVVLQDVVMDGGALVAPDGASAPVGLAASGSRIYALECEFVGGRAAGGDGAPGMRLDGTTIWFTGSSTEGGDGAILETDDPVPAPLGGAGGELANQSRLELFGGFGNAVRGGRGGGVLDATGTVPVTPGPGAPGLIHSNGSSTVLAGGSSIQGGPSVDGSSQGPPSVDDGTGGLLFFLESNLGLRADKTLVSQFGETVTLTVAGNSNALAGTFFGFDLVPQYSILPWFGDLQIDPFLPTIIPTINTGFFGQGSLSLPVPPLPPGLTLYLQTIDVGPSFAPSASQPLYLQIVP